MKHIDGTQYKWNITGHNIDTNRKKSSLHIKCRDLLLDMFGTCVILEEVPIKPTKTQTLYLDFYIPLHKLAIEVDGEQHYKYNTFFFKNKLQFANRLKQDRVKTEWCDINSLSLIRLKYDDIDNWRGIISAHY